MTVSPLMSRDVTRHSHAVAAAVARVNALHRAAITRARAFTHDAYGLLIITPDTTGTKNARRCKLISGSSGEGSRSYVGDVN